MMIKFTCPKCGQVFNAEDKYVGTKLQCGYCNTWFYIPKKGAAPELIQPGSKNAVNAHQKKRMVAILNRIDNHLHQHQKKVHITVQPRSESRTGIYLGR